MTDFTPITRSTVHDIKAVLGDAGWKAADDSPKHLEDPRGRFHGQSALVALPASVEEVSRIVTICNQNRVAIIPYSGGTGVVAGQLSIGSAEAVTVSLERMNRVREVSVADSVLVAEAGCILEDIHHAAARHGLLFPLSMGSKGSCRIGGNLATNAGGIQVLRYGNARDLCLGIEAVLPDGSVLNELTPLRKNNTGYDLRHLLVGSEGTLGIITAASLSLKPQPPETVTAFCAVRSPGDAVVLLNRLRAGVGETVSAIELMCKLGLELVLEHFPGRARPLGQAHDWYLLIEVAGQSGIRAQFEECLAGLMQDEMVSDAVIAGSDAQRGALWELREVTPEANKLSGAFCNSDTSVSVSRIADFVDTTTGAVAKVHEGLRLNYYGHIGDGNIHCNVFPPRGIAKADFIAARPDAIEAVRMAINETTVACGGAISAEHGIGRLKAGDLQHYASPAKLNALRAIKQALDPNNIMNPGAMLAGGFAVK